MKRALFLLMMLIAAASRAESVPMIDIIDDAGRVRSMAEWKGLPTILAPIYTRCPLACPLIVKGLKKGVASSSASATSYRVVLLSFDPRDTPADLKRFREWHAVPIAWTVATAAKPGDARRLLDSLGYRYADANGLFTHPNEIIALNDSLEPAKILLGTEYDIDEALAVARGGRNWIGRYGAWMLALAILIAILSAVYLVTLIGTRAAAMDAH